MDASETDDGAGEGEYLQEIAYVIPDVETTCGICHAEFLDSEDLAVHIKQVHEGSRPHAKTCQFCDVTYTDLEDYSRHFRDAHLCQIKSCRCCTKCFSDERKAKKHEKKHFNKCNLYSCSQCNGLLSTLRELELHETINHDNNFDGVILKCRHHLSALLKLKVTMLLQNDEPALICHSCGFTSIDLTEYNDHLKVDKCQVFVCEKCGNLFKAKKSLRKHFLGKNKCMDSNDYLNGLTTCPTCKNEVHSKKMHAHMKSCKVYKCFLCNIRFETIDMLSVHQTEVHPLELDVWKCKYCSREYVGSKALEKHIDRSHRHTFFLYKYACKECGDIFKHPQKLFAHYFTHHKQLAPYTCRICNIKFKIRKRFTIHIKLEHKSAGSVEFDEQYHVFFAEKKSEKPFIPTCVIPELIPPETSDINKKTPGKANKLKDIEGSMEKTKKRMGNSDHQVILNTDTEADNTEALSEQQTEPEEQVSVPKKKTRKRKRNKDLVTISSSSEEDDAEPLFMIKKRAERKRFQQYFSPGTKRMKELMLKRKQFTCKVCKKYCYTYQNYHNHIKIHQKNEAIQCIKCSKSFMTKNELTEHVATDHATSRLIETLKSVLERKQGEGHTNDNTSNNSNQEITSSERFTRTIVRVKFDKNNSVAKITPAPNNLSVKKFLENFVPDVGDTPKAKAEPSLTIKQFDSPFYRKPTIKMIKCQMETSNETFQLKMPQKFKEQQEEKVKLSIRLVQQPIRPSLFESEKLSSFENTDQSQDCEDYEDYKNDIPDVAQEVMLEETEEPKQNIQAPQKILIPKLPQGYPNLHIATLQAQAPYYKIIKVNSDKDEPIVIETSVNKEPENPEIAPKDEVILLPDGSKFVTANPLAHLLGDKAVEEVLEPIKNKHYKPVVKNFKGLLAEALLNLDKPGKGKKTKKKASEVPARKS